MTRLRAGLAGRPVDLLQTNSGCKGSPMSFFLGQGRLELDHKMHAGVVSQDSDAGPQQLSEGANKQGAAFAVHGAHLANVRFEMTFDQKVGQNALIESGTLDIREKLG